MVSKSTLDRIDKDFREDMKQIAKLRLDSGLAKLKPNELSVREMTTLLRRTEGYKQSLEELKIKPKRENIKRIRL